MKNKIKIKPIFISYYLSLPMQSIKLILINKICKSLNHFGKLSLFCEFIEDLLDCSLTNSILLYLKSIFVLLHEFKATSYTNFEFSLKTNEILEVFKNYRFADFYAYGADSFSYSFVDFKELYNGEDWLRDLVAQRFEQITRSPNL